MADNVNSSSGDWRTAVEKHCKVLTDHLELWEKIEQNLSRNSSLYSTASKCLKDTRDMIRNIEIARQDKNARFQQEHSLTSTLKHLSEDPEDQPSAKRTKVDKTATVEATKAPVFAAHIPPVKDESGLFTIDPNPSKVEALLHKFDKAITTKHGKRRRSAEETIVPELPTAPANAPNGPSKKRKTAMEVTQALADDVEEFHKAFEAKVELRLKQKEETLQQNSNKKRKRDSNGTAGPDRELVDIVKGLPAVENTTGKQKRHTGMQSLFAMTKEQKPDTTWKVFKNAYAVGEASKAPKDRADRASAREARRSSAEVIDMPSSESDEAPKQKGKKRPKLQQGAATKRSKRKT